MIEAYLFDWGDTLMVDFPGVPGKMCNWEVVEAVDGAKETLENLSREAKIYVATGAAESTEADIEKAFERVGLNKFISGYFCKTNLGIGKGTPGFLETILTKLKIPASKVAMVGDNIKMDIEPALAVGINPIWFSKNKEAIPPENSKMIVNLDELYIFKTICGINQKDRF